MKRISFQMKLPRALPQALIGIYTQWNVFNIYSFSSARYKHGKLEFKYLYCAQNLNCTL